MTHEIAHIPRFQLRNRARTAKDPQAFLAAGGALRNGLIPAGDVETIARLGDPGFVKPTDPIEASGIRRHTEAATTGTFRTDAERFFGALDITAPTPGEQVDIRQRELDVIQTQIDAIDEVFAGLVSGARERGRGALGRARAISARGGLLGGEFGEQRRVGVETRTKEEIAGIRVRQVAATEAVRERAFTRATALIESEKSQALKNQAAVLAFRKQQQDEAREDIKTLAGAGIEFDALGSDQLDELLDQSGYDPFIFAAVYNAQLPKNQQKDYTYFKLGDAKIIRFDKAGGEPEEFEFPVPAGFEFVMAGSIPIFVNEATQEVKIATPEGVDPGEFVKETELDTFTDAQGNRVSVMYNPVTKKTRTIVHGKAETGFKPRAFEVSAVNSFITDQAKKENRSADAEIEKARTDPAFFFFVLNQILDLPPEESSRYYKPVTIGIPVGL